ncbi:hypothetical protein LUZ60_017731 [Juncus effusus]|nr:hypothetical protein LUZ60_017731 [Juncus effusus]
MVGFGELVSAVVVNLMRKLGSDTWQRIGELGGFNDELREMRNFFEEMARVLGNAGNISTGNRIVWEWLKILKSAVYDIEDMMSDFETNPRNSSRDRRIRQIKDMVFTFRHELRILEYLEYASKNVPSLVNDRETTSLFPLETVGREREKRELLDLLRQPHHGEDVLTIAIVGLAGIGKTRLAQLIYNDKSVKEAFDFFAWVYVSMEFDPRKIERDICESHWGCPDFIHEAISDIHQSIKHIISGKRYLIVLDDLWEEDGEKLEMLRQMLCWGSEGSKIIVTTRSKNVAVQICAARSYELAFLSDDHCWSLFSQIAFRYRCESETNDNNFERTGKEMVKKCGGIPLAIEALGGIMQSEEVDTWLTVRYEMIFQTETAMLLSLKRSYGFMHSYLKLCFMYCAIFPKGHAISKNELIQQWIALGFIKESVDFSLEKRGEEYVKNLLDVFFLRWNYSDELLCMYDLVHDFARSIIGNELLVLDSQRDGTNQFVDNDCRYASVLNFEDLANRTLPNKIRAIVFNDNSERTNTRLHLDRILHAKFLRVVQISCSCLVEFPSSMGVLKQLRYLSVQCAELQVFPESLGDLINLRHLDIQCNHCNKLPETLGNLTNLQVMILSSCSELEFSFGNLTNLRHLDMSSGRFKTLPETFSNLTNLQVLILNGCSELEFLPEPLNPISLQVLKLRSCRKLRKLPDSNFNLAKHEILDLSYCQSLSITPSFASLTSLIKLNVEGCQYSLSSSILHGLPSNVVLLRQDPSDLYDIVELNKIGALEKPSHSLEIALLEHMSDAEDFAKASLSAQAELLSLRLSWTYPRKLSLQESTKDDVVLEKLMPNKSLRQLHLDGYSFRNFPTWIMKIGDNLPYLSSLHLENMNSCDHLPPLGLLPNLANVILRNMPELRKIDDAFLNGQGAFKKLCRLTLDSLFELEEWPTKQAGNNGKLVFTELWNLEVQNCPRLIFKPYFPGSRKLRIEKSPNTFSSETSEPSTSLTRTQVLEIKSFEFVSGTLPDIIRGMTSLEKLKIESCENLTEMPEWLGELVSLEWLIISDCKSLRKLPLSVLNLPSIGYIKIQGCNQTLVELCSKDVRFRITKSSSNEDSKDVMFNKDHLMKSNWKDKMKKLLTGKGFQRQKLKTVTAAEADEDSD